MAYAPPSYSRSRVDRAGVQLAAGEATEEDLEVINNWRSGHALPLNTVYNTLNRRVHALDPHALVSQRMKRVASIDIKLKRRAGMKLSRMQDIGGCRAVASDARQIDELRARYSKSTAKSMELLRTYDYVTEPKEDGYRGIHLIFAYVGSADAAYNGLQVEMQLRSRLQHAWATAVETVDTVLRQGLKTGGGQEDWRRFFALAGSVHADHEGTPWVPNTPSTRFELTGELRALASQLQVEKHLSAVKAAVKHVATSSASGDKYYLLQLQGSTVQIQGYKQAELEQANAAALEAEKAGANAVVVSVESAESLQQAYPNYFLDTQVFLDSLTDTI